MNDEQFHYWQGYIDQCAALMGVGHLRVALSREPPTDKDGDTYCSIWAPGFYEAGAIHVSETFLLNSSPEEQRHGIVHELCHLYLAGIPKLVDTLLDGTGDVVFSTLPRLLANEIERSTDWIATGICHLLPLPEGPRSLTYPPFSQRTIQPGWPQVEYSVPSSLMRHVAWVQPEDNAEVVTEEAPEGWFAADLLVTEGSVWHAMDRWKLYRPGERTAVAKCGYEYWNVNSEVPIVPALVNGVNYELCLKCMELQAKG